MNSQSLKWLSFLHLLHIIQFFILLQSCNGFSYREEFYHTCGNTFSCGPAVAGIGYPFRGHDDPPYCGHPSLVLTCNAQSNITTIDIMNTTFRVLDIRQATQTMRIVREDVMKETCPQQMVNTTLDYSVFDYAASYANFTFLYGCPATDLPGLSLVSCGYSDVYVLPGAVGPGKCNASVIVPVVLPGDGGSVDVAHLSQVMQQGFEIRWKIGTQGCSDCTLSKGRCGYSFESDKTACFCPGPPYVSDTCMANGSLPANTTSLGMYSVLFLIMEFLIRCFRTLSGGLLDV